MFLTKEDYRVVAGETALKTISQLSEENVARAEAEAVAEISSYLRPAYDTDAVFGAEGTDRNALIVMYTADVALYHMAASLPGRMGIEIRKERYERALKWLEGVQAGTIVPDLPEAEDSQPIMYSSQKKLRHNW